MPGSLATNYRALCRSATLAALEEETAASMDNTEGGDYNNNSGSSPPTVTPPPATLPPAATTPLNVDHSALPSLAEQIAEKVLNGLGVTTGMNIKETINDAIAANLSKNVIDDNDGVQSDWLEADGNSICVTCMNLETLIIPQSLKSFRKGKFGVISNRSPYEMKRNKISHEH